MEFTVVLVKNTQDIVDVIPTKYLSNFFRDNEKYESVNLILDQEITLSGVDTLSVRRNNSTIEVYSDPAKYKTSAMMRDIRQKRDTLLKLSDWAVLPDVDLDDETKQELIEYRKQLRNITDSNTYPHNIKLPKHRLINPPWESNVIN